MCPPAESVSAGLCLVLSFLRFKVEEFRRSMHEHYGDLHMCSKIRTGWPRPQAGPLGACLHSSMLDSEYCS